MLETSHRKFRTSPCTPSCKNYENEILKRPPSSNFISHSESCRSILLGKTWEAYQNPDGALGEVATVAQGSGLVAQRSMMEDFSARGLANPAKTVTQKGFREHLVMGLVEDDLPYSLGEKQGMRKLFAYLVPQGVVVPSHQTVRRDIDLLHVDLNTKLNERLQVSFVVHAGASYSRRTAEKQIKNCHCKRSLDKQEFGLCICRSGWILD